TCAKMSGISPPSARCSSRPSSGAYGLDLLLFSRRVRPIDQNPEWWNVHMPGRPSIFFVFGRLPQDAASPIPAGDNAAFLGYYPIAWGYFHYDQRLAIMTSNRTALVIVAVAATGIIIAP